MGSDHHFRAGLLRRTGKRRSDPIGLCIDFDRAALPQAAFLVGSDERVATTARIRAASGGLLVIAPALVAQAFFLLRASERIAPATDGRIRGAVRPRRPFAFTKIGSA